MKKSHLAWMALAIFVVTTLLAQYIIAVTNTVDPSIKSKQSDASSTKIILPPSSEQVEAAINKWRANEGLTKFNSNVPALDKAAQARAEGMCKDNDWSHEKDWQVLDQYYSYSYAGENLYYGSLQENQQSDAVKTWVASPSHLENLKADYSQIGVGVKQCSGFQGNHNAVIITNYFGVPR